MSFDPEKITFFAKTDARGSDVPFGIRAKDRTKHMYVIGKTGMGKSTLLENMAVQDMQSGEGMAFIDPHGQTAETLLDYIPEERKQDVLYFAPFDTDNPVAFNVMEDVGPERRHLVVSGLMSVFKKIWVDAWSARMEYILQNTLLALLEYPDSTLLGVNRMLSDKKYRRKVIDNISDPAVKSFWVDEFLNYNERYMQEAGDAIKNKIGQFTANPLIRNIIGQPKSSFDIRKIMDEKKILIMNLSKGLVGESNANLLGSMLTTRIYLAAMSRADLPAHEMKQMPNFYFYVDEFQSFANATFADILSEARKYKLNLTIAHQYIEQMEEEVRNAVFGNVGTIVSFRVGPFDAEVLETIYAPSFYAVDIVNLGFAQIYLTLMIDGIGSAPFSASTLPPIPPKSESCKEMVVHASRKQFAKPRAEVEAQINAWHEEGNSHQNQNNGGSNGGNKNNSGQQRGGNNNQNNKPRGGNDTRPPRQAQPAQAPKERFEQVFAKANAGSGKGKEARAGADNRPQSQQSNQRASDANAKTPAQKESPESRDVPRKESEVQPKLSDTRSSFAEQNDSKEARVKHEEQKGSGEHHSRINNDRRSESRSQQSNQRPPRPTDQKPNEQKEKSLDDLRAVLTRLKEEDAAEKAKAAAKKPPQPVTRKQQFDNRQSNSTKSEVSLKDAVAAAVAQQPKSTQATEQKKPEVTVSEKKPSDQDSVEKSARPEPAPEKRSDEGAAAAQRAAESVEREAAAQRAAHAASQPPRPTHYKSPAQEAGESIYRAIRNHDPLDPKLLERMLRISSADKTPLK